MSQQQVLEKLKKYADFSQGGNGSYKAKKDDATITIHTNGKVQIQGKNKEKIEQEINEILGREEIYENNKQLFIVYGHDKIAKEQLEYILQKLDIQTAQITNNTGMTIIEALEKETSRVHAGIILLTPDDISLSKKDYEAHKDNIEGYIHARARQNVILEMGMIMAKLGRKNTIILSKGEVETPSDIDGIFRLQFKENPKEILKKLVERLEECGFVIDKENVFKAMD
ncbi:DUF3378 domain-containing protein [Helicobacter turcicus]|uniref:DUF3378 domain-containing protein n=1 Tax=Helicobacter turcicus TaxID=2867412 RepID=A0ABS7JKT2_9HELI|nr:DUF3378 domain-containing protein [Helicobacter turcicus]MBX7490002.1 DUF3378 domain-containing protein [Helicobacter turcicus]MBX7544861.1 DUF3378 domain-containing protein [Helicobacter turcicus]